MKEYALNNIFAVKGEIFIYKDFMYILGGVVDNKDLSNEMYRFSLSEFNNTKVKRELKLKKVE